MFNSKKLKSPYLTGSIIFSLLSFLWAKGSLLELTMCNIHDTDLSCFWKWECYIPQLHTTLEQKHILVHLQACNLYQE